MSSFPPAQLKYKLALIDIQKQRMSRLAIWRSSIVAICTVGVFLLTILPYWQIQHQSQIQIQGNRLVSNTFIYSTLNFEYPQFIWTIDGAKLAKKIESLPSINAIRINKNAIPPKLIITLQEKHPIAIAISSGDIGFLDFSGYWIAQKFYDNLNEKFALPKIKVINYKPEYQQKWRNLYELISLYSELNITEVQWSESRDLLLSTKIGKVFLGSDSALLEEQFTTMLELLDLKSYVKTGKIAYIDLSNPKSSVIQRY